MKVTAVATILGLTAIASAGCQYELTGVYTDAPSEPDGGFFWEGSLQDGIGIYQNNPILCGQGSGVDDGSKNERDELVIACQSGFQLTLTDYASHAVFVNGANKVEWDTGATASEKYKCGDSQLADCTDYVFDSTYGCD